MEAQLKPKTSIYKFIIIFLMLIIVVFLAFNWLSKDVESTPQVTEHHFENGNAVWSIEAYPAKVLHNNTFKIKLTDLSGNPIRGADLSVKLEMMEMVCGDYAFNMTEISPGTYVGEGVPLMAGTWKASLTFKINEHTNTITRLLRAVH